MSQVVKYVQIHQYICEFERVFLSSPISVGEFYLIFSYAQYAVMPVRNTWQVGNLNIEEPIKFQFWETSGSEKMEILNLFLC